MYVGSTTCTQGTRTKKSLGRLQIWFLFRGFSPIAKKQKINPNQKYVSYFWLLIEKVSNPFYSFFVE